MSSRAAQNEGMEVRKAEVEARAKALRNPSRVVPLVIAVDPECVRRPLIFENVHIPEADLDESDDV